MGVRSGQSVHGRLKDVDHLCLREVVWDAEAALRLGGEVAGAVHFGTGTEGKALDCAEDVESASVGHGEVFGVAKFVKLASRQLGGWGCAGRACCKRGEDDEGDEFGVSEHEACRMQGLRKILRALAIVIFPVVGAVIVYGGTSGMETVLGLFLILVAFGLIATWFW